ncbi:hypothetical protein [Novosphingobium sp.]|uniref:hypothetical protein n=1 Tax=Novosphingobium sp. TaxID=1874826 RepID=UPI00352ADAB9
MNLQSMAHGLSIASLAAIALMATTVPAQAYVGPGLGLGAISTALGVVGAILLGIVSFVWYPVKRLVRAARRKPAAPTQADAQPETVL